MTVFLKDIAPTYSIKEALPRSGVRARNLSGSDIDGQSVASERSWSHGQR